MNLPNRNAHEDVIARVEREIELQNATLREAISMTGADREPFAKALATRPGPRAAVALRTLVRA